MRRGGGNILSVNFTNRRWFLCFKMERDRIPNSEIFKEGLGELKENVSISLNGTVIKMVLFFSVKEKKFVKWGTVN